MVKKLKAKRQNDYLLHQQIILNIYKKLASGEFENILKEPIYIQFEKSQIRETLIIDISNYDIEVKGDFLITVELIKDLGPGSLMFCCNLFGAPTYYRGTSQGGWHRVPMNIGIGINVEAMVEK
jgi:hypothetical protein